MLPTPSSLAASRTSRHFFFRSPYLLLLATPAQIMGGLRWYGSRQGEPGVFRVRVGDFRILYEVLNGLLLVQVVRIGHCREVYR